MPDPVQMPTGEAAASTPQPKVTLRDYAFDAAADRQFWRWRERLYRGDPEWIPTTLTATLRQLAPAAGRVQRHFLATVGGEIAGHVLAFVTPALRDVDGTQVGGLGFFECIDDPAVADPLLTAAMSWLGRQGKVTRVLAPVDGDIWHGYRFRISGFAVPPFPGEPYHKAYYPAVFAAHGFTVRKRWCSVEIDVAAMRGLLTGSAAAHSHRLAEGYRFVPVDADAEAALAQLHRLVLQCYRGFLGFCELSAPAFAQLYGPLWRRADPRLMSLVVSPRGQPVGFSIAYPDLGDTLRRWRGGWLDRLRLLWRPPEVRRVIWYLIGITPEEVERHHHLGLALFHHTLAAILDAGYPRAVLALLGEDSRSRALAGRFLDEAQVQYALLQRELP